MSSLGKQHRLFEPCALTLFMLLASVAPLQAQERDNYIVLDSSGSMRGKCGASYAPCGPGQAACPAEFSCGGVGPHCQMVDLEKRQKCDDIWDSVRDQARDYVKSLQVGTVLHVYIFDHAGVNPLEVPLFTNALVNDAERDAVDDHLGRIPATAMATGLYDIVSKLYDRMEAEGTQAGKRRMLWVFTDGEDNASRTINGPKLRDKLKCVVESSFTWQVVRPEGALDPLCKGNPCCVTADVSKSTRWKIHAEPTQLPASMSLDHETAHGEMRIFLDEKGLFPWEIEVRFEPDADSAAILVGPAATHLTSFEFASSADKTLQLQWRLDADLARPKPSELSGNLVLVPRSGKVEIGGAKIPVRIPLNLSNFAQSLHSTSPFDKPAGTRIGAPAGGAVRSILSSKRGYGSLTWHSVDLAEQAASANLMNLQIVLDANAFRKNGELVGTVSSAVPRGARNSGELVIPFDDANGWAKIGTVALPIRIAEPTRCLCDDGLRCPGGTRESCNDSESFVWILWLLLALTILVVGWFMLRYPDVDQLSLQVTHSPDVIVNLLPLTNGFMRLTQPTAEIPVQKLTNRSELTGEEAAATPTGNGSNSTDPENSGAPEWDLSAVEKELAMLRVQRNGRVVISTPSRILRVQKAQNDQRIEWRERLEIATIGADLTDVMTFQLLNQGPAIEAVLKRDR